MKISKTPLSLAVALLGGVGLVGLVGCEEDAMEDAGDDIGQAAENAADATEDAAEEAADNLEDATDG